MRETLYQSRDRKDSSERLTPESPEDLQALGAAAMRELQRAEIAFADPGQPRAAADFQRITALRNIVNDYLKDFPADSPK